MLFYFSCSKPYIFFSKCTCPLTAMVWTLNDKSQNFSFDSLVRKNILPRVMLVKNTVYRTLFIIIFLYSTLVFCKWLFIQLSNWNNLIYPRQSGFRKNHSTDTALIQIIDELLFRLDKNRVSGMVLADYCKAFDMVDQVFINDLPLHVSLCIQTSPSLREKLGIFPEGGGDVWTQATLCRPFWNRSLRRLC